MMRMFFIFLTIVVSSQFAAGAMTQDAHAQTSPEEAPASTAQTAPPYDDRLLRLAEILGSVQYLRNLCSGQDETAWRESMQALLDSETANEAGRREILTAGYNRGFRAFASVYTSCTDAARVAEARYRREGATLVTEIVARYGN